MNWQRAGRALGALSLAVTMLGAVACREEGPAERAGEELDDAGEDLSDAVDPKGPAEETGRALDRATGADED